MGRKTVEDLDDDPAAVGGAMSQWPRRTLAWLCRDARVNATDVDVAEALVAREVRDLDALAEKADRVGIGTGTLDKRRRAIGEADVLTIIETLDREYRRKYSTDGGDYFDGEATCPFEESGLDKACWRCPVPGNTLNELE